MNLIQAGSKEQTIFAWGRDVSSDELARRVAESSWVTEIAFQDEDSLRRAVARLVTEEAMKGYDIPWVHMYAHPTTAYIHLKHRK